MRVHKATLLLALVSAAWATETEDAEIIQNLDLYSSLEMSEYLADMPEDTSPAEEVPHEDR